MRVQRPQGGRDVGERRQRDEAGKGGGDLGQQLRTVHRFRPGRRLGELDRRPWPAAAGAGSAVSAA